MKTKKRWIENTIKAAAECDVQMPWSTCLPSKLQLAVTYTKDSAQGRGTARKFLHGFSCTRCLTVAREFAQVK